MQKQNNMRKTTEIGGFRIILKKKEIRVETLTKDWAMIFKEGTTWYSSLNYHLGTDLENVEMLLTLAYSNQLMLSDMDFLKKYGKLVTDKVNKKVKNKDKDSEKIIMMVEKLKEGVL